MYNHICMSIYAYRKEKFMSKKSFTNIENPALNFISTPKEEAQTESKKTQNVPVKLNPIYIETKSKRFNFLMQPSLYDKISNRARVENKSMSDLIHSVLDDYFDKN